MKNEIVEMVIDVISYDQGWEETGDYYRCLFGLEPKYGDPVKPNNDLKIKNVNRRLGDIEAKLGETITSNSHLMLVDALKRIKELEDRTNDTI